jgi:hypothetical protein
MYRIDEKCIQNSGWKTEGKSLVERHGHRG